MLHETRNAYGNQPDKLVVMYVPDSDTKIESVKFVWFRLRHGAAQSQYLSVKTPNQNRWRFISVDISLCCPLPKNILFRLASLDVLKHRHFMLEKWQKDARNRNCLTRPCPPHKTFETVSCPITQWTSQFIIFKSLKLFLVPPSALDFPTFWLAEASKQVNRILQLRRSNV